MATRSVRIGDLSDEVIVHIFSFLSSSDIINLEKTCKRFHVICCEKKIVGCSNFTYAYKLSPSILKNFFYPKLRCANVIELNLNYCYWLPASAFNVVSKLKNLKHLHVLDCRISFTCLHSILNGLNLRSLSWTLDNCVRRNDLNDKIKDSFGDILRDLQNLKIHIIDLFQLSQLCFLLQCSSHLQSLEVLESAASYSENLIAYPSHPYVLNLQHLTSSKFILQSSFGIDEKGFIHKILDSTNPNKQFSGFWTTKGGCSVLLKLFEENNLMLSSLQNADFLSLDGRYDAQLIVIRMDKNGAFLDFAKKVLSQKNGLPKCRQLSLARQRLDGELLHYVAHNCPKLEFLSLEECHAVQAPSEICEGLMTIAELNHNLTALNLLGTHIHSSTNPCEFFNSITNLQLLALPACMLTWVDENVTIQEENIGYITFKRTRQGTRSSFTEAQIRSSRLYSLTQNCSKLKTLIIEGNFHSFCEKICQNVTEKDLLCISNWKSLRILILKDLPGISTGNFFTNICKNCTQLHHLNIINVGSRGVCKYIGSLIQALQYSTHLEDFRIEQKSGINFVHLHRGLRNCKALQQFALMCVHSGTECALTPPEMIKMVEEMPNLISLRLVIPFSSEAHCKRLTHSLENHFSSSRPAFKVKLCPPEKYCLRARYPVKSEFGDEIMQSVLNVNSLMTF